MKTTLLTAVGSASAAAALKSLHALGHRVIGCDIYPQAWNSVSGEVEMSLQQTKNVQVDTVSGDVQLFCAAAPENIRADGVSADMTVQLPENAGFAAELDSVSGRISGQLLEGSTGGKSYTRGSGECHIRMNSVSGDLKLDAYHR